MSNTTTNSPSPYTPSQQQLQDILNQHQQQIQTLTATKLRYAGYGLRNLAAELFSTGISLLCGFPNCCARPFPPIHPSI